MSNTRIASQVLINNDMTKKQPWLPEVKEVSGLHFVKLHKWDRGFTRYVSGKCLDLRKGHACNIGCDFLDNLQSKVHEASKEAVKRVLDAEVEEQDAGKPKPKRRRIVRADDKHLGPEWITVHLPPLGEFHAIDVRILWSVKGADLWVELNSDVLEYIRQAILESQQGLMSA
ncbi:unnamed protein product [Effrenium voratum]|uniref:Uncharacterized protein n=1 Tax=Effrenium voratum TaxID=2562239 RepID=A0AA36HKN8_9DINO|nr:unnamed protein product [Effrenium voratum]CAJ1458861.1 unnamed protein product [Effrenium voratum]